MLLILVSNLFFFVKWPATSLTIFKFKKANFRLKKNRKNAALALLESFFEHHFFLLLSLLYSGIHKICSNEKI